jgi:uncharacterized protein with FMN-binding domain
MRRAFLAITGLAASTTALVVLKGSPGASQVAQDLPAQRQPVVPAGSGPARAPVTSATGAPAVSASAPSSRPSADAGRTPDTRTTTRPPSAPKPTTAPPRTTTRTVTGPVISYEYGNAQVQITVSGSRIINAVALELPQGGQSGQRSDKVDARYSGTSGAVVTQQSANLDTVSTATATSNAYKQSLQAAIDAAF